MAGGVCEVRVRVGGRSVDCKTLESTLPMRRGLPACVRTQICVCAVGILPRTAKMYDIVVGCTLTPIPTYTYFNPILLSFKFFNLIVLLGLVILFP